MPDKNCAIKLELPAWLRKEISRVYVDLKHASNGEFDQISLESQVMLAKKMKELAENKGSTLEISVKPIFEIANLPSAPDLKLYLHFKDTRDMLKAKPDGVGIMYEMYRW